MDILGAEVDRSAQEYQELQKEKEAKVNSLLKQMKSITETNARLKHLVSFQVENKSINVFENASHNHSVKRLNDEKFTLQQSIDAQRVVVSKQKTYIASVQEQLSTIAARNVTLLKLNFTPVVNSLLWR